MGKVHSFPSSVHRIISSNALLGGSDINRSESSASSLSNNVDRVSRGSSAHHDQNTTHWITVFSRI